jgi:hypothetical protein
MLTNLTNLTGNQDVIVGAVGVGESTSVGGGQGVEGKGGGDAGTLLVLNAAISCSSSDARGVPD